MRQKATINLRANATIMGFLPNSAAPLRSAHGNVNEQVRFFLELEKAPCQLNHAASNAGIASASKTLLSSSAAALIGCTCEAGVAVIAFFHL